MPSPIFDAPLTSTLVPTTAGNPAFTFTRATTAYVADQDGILRQAQPNEARFQGARRVRNCVSTTSEDFSNAAAWQRDATVTVTALQVDPLGGTTAYKIASTTANAGIYNNTVVAVPGNTATSSVWMRGEVGGEVIILGQTANVTLTTSWQRFSTNEVYGDAFLRLRPVAANKTFYVWHAQAEVVNGQSNQAPGEYVSSGVLSSPWHGAGIDATKYFATTNGNSVAGNIVTEATGTLLATTLGYVAENAATNLCLQSQTFDDVGWPKSNAVIAANNVAAPDGTLTADRFTDDATSGIHRIQGNVASVAGVYTHSIYLKAGTLTWMQLSYFDFTTTFWANFNIATGAIGFKQAGTTATITALPNGWYRCSITFTAAANGISLIYSLNADTNSAGPSYVGTGQTMYLWGAQVEASSDPSSYIPTTTAAVVRNGDRLGYQAATNLNLPLATTYSECYLPTAAVGVQQMVLWLNSDTFGPHFYNSGKSLAMYSGGGAPVTANLRTVGAVNKNASAWGGATASACLNGGTVATSALTVPTVGGSIDFGTQNGGTPLQGSIRNVKFYNVRLTDSQLIQLTTDGFLPPDVVPVVPSTEGGIGARVRRYRRIEVEIDGEIFPVASEEEGRELLLKAREAAKQAAQAAAVRAAAKAEKKTSPAAVERALALSTPRISLRADDRSEALAQAIQSQVDAAQAAIDEDYATARRMAYAYVRQRLQDEQRQRELAADEEEVIAMILRLP